MLGLKLRSEFLGRRLKGTSIELSNDKNTGAIQIDTDEFLEITYPTLDLLKSIEAVGPDKGRPVVVIGERGLGKSHLMAALYHTVSHPISTRTWLLDWAVKLGDPNIGAIPLRDKMLVIGESLHRQRYKFLWEVLFEKHPHGIYIKGKWEGMGPARPDIPSDQLIIELLKHTPMMLLLDEFQTWFDGLKNSKQSPWKAWAFNFIQILSEIAKEHPELLVLVVSVRNGTSDAYQQIHRVNPVQVDFRAGGSPDKIQNDRRRMLLHRLFENRLQIEDAAVDGILATHVAESFRLLNFPPAEQDRKKQDFRECWPFAPHLLQLLEDQVLVATDAQESRDLIRILASLFKSHGENTPILTSADFELSNDATGIGALLDSVANQHHRALGDKARRNLTAVTDAVPNHRVTAPHLENIVGALWLRSIAVGNLAGAEPATLQVDITKTDKIDDNSFQVELATIIENSFNIHQEGTRLLFKEEENPQAKVMASAKNDRLFSNGTDLVQLAKEIRYAIGGTEEVAVKFRVIALPRDWITDPWTGLEDSEHPDKWDDRLPILALPEEPDLPNETLGKWLKEHVQKRRNTVRFLLPRSGVKNAFFDRDLLILARAGMMAQEWSSQSPEYRKLQTKYQSELRDILKKRYDRFAVLHQWNYSDTTQCLFQIEKLKEQGSKIPDAIENAMASDLFVPEDFLALVLEAANNNDSVGKLLKELQEPRPLGKDCIPWLGEPVMKERIIKLCASGKVAINSRGTEHLQAQAGEDEDAAWIRMRSKLGITGRMLDEVFLQPPSAVPSTGGSAPASPPAGDPPAGGLFGGPAAGGEQLVDNPTATGATDPVGNPTPTDGGIFGGGASGVRPPLSSQPTSPLNLIGKIESWGIGPETPVKEVNLKISTATGAQLKELLKKLPDGMTFEISLDKEDS